MNVVCLCVTSDISLNRYDISSAPCDIVDLGSENDTLLLHKIDNFIDLKMIF